MVSALHAPIDEAPEKDAAERYFLGRAESVSGLAADDAERLRALVDGYYGSIWRALRRLGVPSSQADDAAQRVFIVAAAKLRTIRREGERQYLYGVALRVASDMRRAVARRRETSELPAGAESCGTEGAPPQPDELLESKRLLEKLDRWLSEMPLPLREAFVLFEIQELSATEVASILKLPLGTVASRVRRARELLRDRYRESHRGEAERGGRQS